MQVLKEELRTAILESAKYEFYIHGFKATSMRTIARKANTTIGNLYNYYRSKEELFDAVIGDLTELLSTFLYNHQDGMEEASKSNATFSEIVTLLREQLPEAFAMKILLSKEFIILMEGAEGTKYENYREEFVKYCTSHMKEHLPGKENMFLTNAIGNSFLSVLICIAKNMKDLDEGIRGLTKYIEILIAGVMAVNEDGDRMGRSYSK